ncbi:hypothetical protein BUE93_15460 [Chromobacterium amazonense]|uniref:Uncharacterized protein n=1 Tax=Chromobacterium amazonense TaxID=1382803 RepID=A0A2S9X2W7_9NEIS|nr:hypothetical protein [Chromobacterium amazonense]PRP70062.1 hypothetical protein BUE93_15460 [Chromobacterium amazonense]
MTMKVLSMANFTRKLLPLLTISVLAACGGGGSGDSSSSGASNLGGNTATQYHIAGQVQKGPFIFGSQIWISELDDKLSPTGKIYLTQTKDDLGNFGIPGAVNTKLVELTGSGYYMNELTGTLSTAPVTLNAVADLSVSKSLTINLLTTLQAPRLKTLMAGGSDYQSAYNQSRNEVLAVFGIDAGKVDNLGSLFDMRINGTADQDSILLATSAVLSQAARNQFSSAETAELSHLISTIASDLANNGKLSSQSLQDQLKIAATQIDLDTVRRNVETYYAGRGIKLVAPKFEEWIDKDNSGVIPRRMIEPSNSSFNTIENATPDNSYTSNSIKVDGLQQGQSMLVQLLSDATLIKNNQIIGKNTTAKNGDNLQIQTIAPSFGESQETKIKLGSKTISWVINSKNTELKFDNTYYDASSYSPSISTKNGINYIAFSFSPDADFTARYAGIDGSSKSSLNISIYDENTYNPNNSYAIPGTSLITSNTKTNSIGKKPVPSVNNKSKSNFYPNGIQFSLGSDGIDLKKGKRYWLVVNSTDKSGIEIKANPGSYDRQITPITYSSNGKSWVGCQDGADWDRNYSPYCTGGGLFLFNKPPAIWLAN